MSTPEPNGGDEERTGLSTGAIVGIVVLALILIVGGLCLWLLNA